MDNISAYDARHRDYMRKASARLLEAITDARNGFNPATPLFPAGLPMEGKEQPKPRPRPPFSLRGVPLLPGERVKHLLDAGATPREIADIMRISMERVNYWIKRVGE